MALFRAYQNWRGLDNRVSRVEWDLGDLAAEGTIDQQFLEANVRRQALASAMLVITNATPNDGGVVYVDAAFVAGAGDLTEKALINVWAQNVEDATDVLAISQIYIPAPKVGIFLAASGKNYNNIDMNDADLQVYIDALSVNAKISDGETIDTAAGINGMDSGRRVTRKLPKQS